MSAATQLAPDAAYLYLNDQVHVPVFFNKLAQHNIVPQTPQEAADLLAAGAKLFTLYQAEQQKTAAARGSIAGRMNQALDSQLTQLGYTPSQVDAEIKTAASQLAQEPEIVRAVLALQAGAAAKA